MLLAIGKFQASQILLVSEAEPFDWNLVELLVQKAADNDLFVLDPFNERQS